MASIDRTDSVAALEEWAQLLGCLVGTLIVATPFASVVLLVLLAEDIESSRKHGTLQFLCFVVIWLLILPGLNACVFSYVSWYRDKSSDPNPCWKFPTQVSSVVGGLGCFIFGAETLVSASRAGRSSGTSYYSGYGNEDSSNTSLSRIYISAWIFGIISALVLCVGLCSCCICCGQTIIADINDNAAQIVPETEVVKAEKSRELEKLERDARRERARAHQDKDTQSNARSLV